jgi:restriction system protein
MLPLLKFIADGKEHTNEEIYDYVANFFKLTETEKAERLAISGKIHYHNIVRWSIIYLKNAGLLEHSKRAIVRITPRGLNVLHKNPKTIDGKYLLRFPEYRIFKGVPSLKSQNGLEDADSTGGHTPGRTKWNGNR